MEESQLFNDFSADFIRDPLSQSLRVTRYWCRVRSRVHFDIAGTLKQKSEQQCRHLPLRHKIGDLASREYSEALAVEGVGRSSDRA